MDKDGYISNGELFQVLKMMVGNNLKDTQLQQIVDKTIINADKDGDGRISFREFCSVSLRPPGLPDWPRAALDRSTTQPPSPRQPHSAYTFATLTTHSPRTPSPRQLLCHQTHRHLDNRAVTAATTAPEAVSKGTYRLAVTSRLENVPLLTSQVGVST